MKELIDLQLILVSAVCCIIVFAAMMIDLASGLYKASLRGDARKSEALKRTGYKFCLYEGSMLIATGVDIMIYMSHVFAIFGIDLLVAVPIVTILLGIFWCVVEFLSVREKADEKMHSTISRAEKLAQNVFSREELVGILADAFRQSVGKKE